ncbi:uncharacterized protein LOC128550163 [Mercenaria mercenaria]|uniref:uncharacterized protein LOC128550163 n=1 Tax=Mercenaria mercenaria TaxID=6596 RepID=UPI00234F0F6F|nr:uncharacterized protein LOC128550163 [Mercenaria mercenaria]
MYIPEVLFIFTFYICSCYGGEEEKRLILHSGDDIAQEFQKLRQELQSLQMNHTREIQLLMTNYTQEVESLKKNYTQTIESLKRNHTQEIQALMSTQTAEIDSVKATQKREIQALNDTQSQKIKSLKNELTTLKQDQGSTYIRWGKTTCGGNGTHIVYTGFTSGSPYDKEGGAAKYICLPKNPTRAKYVDGIQNIGGYMTGTEFDIYLNIFNPFPRNMQDQDAPCVLCRSPKPTTVMVPGRTNCYPG